MSANPIRPTAPKLVQAPPRDDHKALRKAADQLQAVFLNQLFQAMRESLPKDDDGMGQGGSGEQMFTSMMDERVSELVAPKMGRGVSDALYRQLAQRLKPETLR